MVSVGVQQLTVGFVEAIDVYGQFMRGERPGSDISVRAAALLFKQAGLAPPTRPPTSAERLAVLRLAALTADPSGALRRGSQTLDADTGQYLSDAFGASVDLQSTATSPERLSDVPNASMQPPEVYLGTSAAFSAPINYGDIPAALPAGTYWSLPAPQDQPYDVVDPTGTSASTEGAPGVGATPEQCPGTPDPTDLR